MLSTSIGNEEFDFLEERITELEREVRKLREDVERSDKHNVAFRKFINKILTERK